MPCSIFFGPASKDAFISVNLESTGPILLYNSSLTILATAPKDGALTFDSISLSSLASHSHHPFHVTVNAFFFGSVLSASWKTIASQYCSNIKPILQYCFSARTIQNFLFLGYFCVAVIASKTRLAPLWTTGAFFHRNESKLPPALVNACVALSTSKMSDATSGQHSPFSTRTCQNGVKLSGAEHMGDH